MVVRLLFCLSGVSGVVYPCVCVFMCACSCLSVSVVIVCSFVCMTV